MGAANVKDQKREIPHGQGRETSVIVIAPEQTEGISSFDLCA
jgi:hypothetical protein